MEEPSLLRRLKDRKLVQWALAYLAGAWVVLEASGHVGEQFGWPATIQKVLIVVAGFGFLVVLVVAWYHGEKGRQWVSGPELLIIALLLLISGGVLALLRGREGRDGAGALEGPMDEKPGVAVLPCNNLSPSAADAYLAAGVHEEILLKLSKISSLRPIGRVSVERFRDDPRPLVEKGSELGVSYVAECSVRKAGDRIRVVFQLMDAADAGLIWTESYDRDYTVENLFDLQSEIARQVAVALEATVLPEEEVRIEARPTESLEAYDLYLLGRSYWNQFSEAGFRRAIDLFQQAISVDPGFGQAYAGIADSYALLTQGWGHPPREVFPQVRRAAQEALRLDPSLPEAHASLGAVRLFYDWDVEGAEEALRRAIELDPNYATARHWLAISLMARARHGECLAEARRALALDPLSPYINVNMGYFLYVAGDQAEAVNHFHRALEIFPEHPLLHAFLGLGRIQQGKVDQAILDLQRAVELSRDDTLIPLPFLGYAYGLAGREEDARDVLQELGELGEVRFVNPDYFSVVHLGLGDLDAAMDWLYEAQEARTDWAFWIPVDPVAYPLHSDSRFVELVRRNGMGEALERMPVSGLGEGGL